MFFLGVFSDFGFQGLGFLGFCFGFLGLGLRGRGLGPFRGWGV